MYTIVESGFRRDRWYLVDEHGERYGGENHAVHTFASLDAAVGFYVRWRDWLSRWPRWFAEGDVLPCRLHGLAHRP